MIDTFARIAFLKRIHLFHGLGDEELAMVADQLEEQACTSGDTIYRQSQKTDNFYLIYKGSAKVATMQKGKEVDTFTLVANDYFGYRNFRVPSASIQAKEYIAYITMLSTLPRDTREKVLSQFPVEGFEGEWQMDVAIYLADPMRFGVRA